MLNLHKLNALFKTFLKLSIVLKLFLRSQNPENVDSVNQFLPFLIMDPIKRF